MEMQHPKKHRLSPFVSVLCAMHKKRCIRVQTPPGAVIGFSLAVAPFFMKKFL